MQVGRQSLPFTLFRKVAKLETDLAELRKAKR